MTGFNFVMTALLNGILEGAFLAVAMFLFLKLLPRLNPTTRYAVWWATSLALVALLVGPFTPGALRPRAETGLAAIAATNNRVSPAPVVTGQPRFSLQNPDTSSASHPVFLPEPNPGTASTRLSEASGRTPTFAGDRTDSSQVGAMAMTAVQRPLIRIRSAGIPAALEIVWTLFSLAMLVRLGYGYGKMRGVKAEATPLPAAWQMRLTSLREENEVRRQVQLLASSRIAAPMSLGFFHPAILIPRTLCETLSDSELEHVVLHEIGHLQRRDDWTNLAQKLMEAILPVQPAIYWIGRQMSIEREMACDDWVIAATGAAEPYATSLARVAELSHWAHADILAAGATGNRSQLFSRVHHMLDRTRNAAPKVALGPLGAAIAAMSILIYGGAHAPQMIAFAQTPAAEDRANEPAAPSPAHTARTPQSPTSEPERNAPPVPQDGSRTPATPATPAVLLASNAALSSSQPSIAPAEARQSDKTHMEMTTHDGWNSLSVKVDGAIEFTDDDQDIQSLSPGGHFRIEEGSMVSARVYDVRADSAGNLSRTYSVGSSVRPLDSEGREWLGRLLPQVIRETGIGAGPRVARILRQGGPPAVIREIGLIHSDGSKRIYLEQLFSQANLNSDQLTEAAKLIRGISSDGDKAQVLTQVDGRYFTDLLRPNLFEAVESISSDGDKRRVLSDIVNKDAGSAGTILSASRAAKRIASDGDKAEVLVEMANPYREDGGLGMAYFEAVNSISSDGDHARVLLAMLAAHGDDRGTLVRVLRSAAKISSDGDKARVLDEAAARYSSDEPVNKAFIDAVNSISSDGDHQRVLVTLVHRRPGIDAATIGEIAKSAQRISSDGDKARVLVELAGANVEPVRDDFFAAADTIHSDGDHSHVLMTLLDKSGTSSAMAVAAIQSASRISSDGDKGRVLLDAAQRYSKDPQVEAALRKAVESLHSDGEYRSVMSEIARQAQSN